MALEAMPPPPPLNEWPFTVTVFVPAETDEALNLHET